MSLWESILKAGMKRSPERNFVDVTGLVTPCLDYNGMCNAVYVNSDMDLRCKKGREFSCRLFLLNEHDVHKVHFQLEPKELNIHIQISTDTENIRGYAEMCLPEDCIIEIRNSTGDTTLSRVTVSMMLIASDTGDVLVEKSEYQDGKITTESGNISVDLKGGYRIQAKTHYGDLQKVSVKNDKHSDKRISCESEYGDILLKNWK